MFKKLKEKIADEVSQNPRLQASLDSVNSLASQTYSAFNKEGSGSRDSLTSLNSQISFSDLQHKGTVSASPSTGQFFSLGEDDDPISLSAGNSPTKTPTNHDSDVQGGLTSTPCAATGSRTRRLSSTSMADASALFPIYEDPGHDSVPLFSDLESTAGSEAGWDDGGSAQLSAVSKEQLYGMLAKMRARYHKYKGRYSDLSKAYVNIQTENQKVKEVMQQTQDKALRRISELREQCSLEQQAKQHLEQEFRAELEEKDHIISTLNTKVGLLKESLEKVPTLDQKADGKLIDLSLDSGLHEEHEEKKEDSDGVSVCTDLGRSTEILCDESEKQQHQGEKIKRLESLLTKCKENIKANKQKIGALSEVKEELATQLQEKEASIIQLNEKNTQLESEVSVARERAQGEEIQLAETKLVMHRELLEKDEQMAELRGNLSAEQVTVKQRQEELATKERETEELRAEIQEMGRAQTTMEQRLEDERKTAMEMNYKVEELSRGKEAALEQERNRLHQLHKKEVDRELKRQEEELTRRLRESEEEGRLGKEEMELRLSALSTSEQQMADQLARLQKEKTELQAQLKKNKAAKEDKKKQEQLKEMDTVKEQMQVVKADNIVLQEKMSSFTKEKTGLQANIDALQESNKTIAKEKERVEEELSELKQNCNELEQRLQYNLESSLKTEEESEKKFKDLEEEKAELVTQVGKLKVEVERSCAEESVQLTQSGEERATLAAELSRAQSQETGLLQSLKSLEANNKDLMQQLETLKDMEDKLASSAEEISSLTDQLKAAKELENKLKSGTEEAETKLLSSSEQISSLKNQLKIAEELKSNLNNSKEEMSSLKDQLIKAQEAETKLISSSEEISTLKDRLKSNLTNSKEEISSLKDQLTKAQEAETKLISSSEEISTLKDQLKTAEEFKSKFNSSKKEITSLKKQLKAAKQLETQLESSNSEVSNLKDQLEALRGLVEELETSNEKMSKLQEENEVLESKLRESEVAMETQLESSRSEVADLKNQLEALRSLEEKLDSSSENMSRLQKDYRSLESKLQESEATLQETLQARDKNREETAREIENLKDQINGKSVLQEQMVSYEKELQSRISTLEGDKLELEVRMKKELECSEGSQRALDDLKASNLEEIETLKKDLDMKIRLERERDTSHKELQKQSIEYGKRLQDQLEEKNNRIDDLVAELESLRNQTVQTSQTNEKVESSLRSEIDTISDNLQQREKEIRNLGEKREQLESLLEGKERHIKQLETLNQQSEAQVTDLTDTLAFKEESLEKLKTGFEATKSEFENKLSTHETEVKKLSKSRDRLKSLLDEKEKALSSLQAEKEQIFGSQEEINSGMKEELSTLRSELATANNNNTLLTEQLDQSRLSSEGLSQESSKQQSELGTLQLQLGEVRAKVEQMKLEVKNVGAERDGLREELIALEQNYVELEVERKDLEDSITDSTKSKSLLDQATSELESRRAEVEELRSKLGQLQEYSSVNELKEENAMLSERLSQYEEERGSSAPLNLQTIREEHLLEVTHLRKQISGLQTELEDWKESTLSNDTEARLKGLVKDWERRLAVKDAEHGQELEVLREHQEMELVRVQHDHRTIINRYTQELKEKDAQLDLLEQQELMNGGAGPDKESDSGERVEELQQKVVELQDKVREFEKQRAAGGWGWEDGEEMIMSMTDDSPAIFGVPNHHQLSSGANNGHSNHSAAPHKQERVEDSPEFEYLRNILYEYMMGHQPLILVKVLAAIVKFSPEQASAILKAEEKKQSYLANLGLLS